MLSLPRIVLQKGLVSSRQESQTHRDLSKVSAWVAHTRRQAQAGPSSRFTRWDTAGNGPKVKKSRFS